MRQIPLFPLPVVLFPGGRLMLDVHEIIYLDLVAASYKEQTGFGIVMMNELEQPESSLATTEVSTVGTYVHPVDFDLMADGTLAIVVEGRSKFHIEEITDQADGLMLGRVRFLSPEQTSVLPEEKAYLAELLESLADHEAVRELELAINFRDALDVSSRLAELIPCSNTDKQQLLELNEPLLRLERLALIVAKLQQSAWI